MHRAIIRRSEQGGPPAAVRAGRPGAADPADRTGAAVTITTGRRRRGSRSRQGMHWPCAGSVTGPGPSGAGPRHKCHGDRDSLLQGGSRLRDLFAGSVAACSGARSAGNFDSEFQSVRGVNPAAAAANPSPSLSRAGPWAIGPVCGAAFRRQAWGQITEAVRPGAGAESGAERGTRGASAPFRHQSLSAGEDQDSDAD